MTKTKIYTIQYWVEESRIATIRAKSKADAIKQWEKDGDKNFITDDINKHADRGIIDVYKNK